MAATRAPSRRPAKAATAKAKATPKAKAARRPTGASSSKTAVARTTELSDEVLQSVEAGQRAALDAVHKFLDTVDRTLPHGEEPSKRGEIVDPALEMADKLVHTQYDFLRKVVSSTGKSLGAARRRK